MKGELVEMGGLLLGSLLVFFLPDMLPIEIVGLLFAGVLGAIFMMLAVTSTGLAERFSLGLGLSSISLSAASALVMPFEERWMTGNPWASISILIMGIVFILVIRGLVYLFFKDTFEGRGKYG